MSRFIDADKILFKLKQMQDYVYEHIGEVRFNPYNLLLQAGDAVIATPTEDVQPIKHGYWNRVDMSFRAYMCSCCDNMATFRFDYCPNCGARMDEEEQEENGTV